MGENGGRTTAGQLLRLYPIDGPLRVFAMVLDVPGTHTARGNRRTSRFGRR